MTLYMVLSSIALAGGILAGAWRIGLKIFRWCRSLASIVAATHARTAELEQDSGKSIRDRVETIHAVVLQLQSDSVAHGDSIRELQEQRRRLIW